MAHHSPTAHHYRSVCASPAAAAPAIPAPTAPAPTAPAPATMSTPAVVSNAAEPATKKRTYDELGNHDDNDDDDSDKNTLSGLAAFFHYAQANHKQVRAALSEKAEVKASFGAVAAELANNYRALSAAESAKWQEIAVAADVDFFKEMKPYSEPTRTTRKKKDKDAPKGPVSAYFHYMMAIRATILADDPKMVFGDVTKECATRFRALTDEGRKEWEDKAVADKVRYKEQLEAYEKEKEAKKKPEDENEDDHEKADKPSKKAKKTPAQEHEKEKAEVNAGTQKEDGPGVADTPKKKKKKAKKTRDTTPKKLKEDTTPKKLKEDTTPKKLKEDTAPKKLKEDTHKKADTPKKKDKKKTLTEEQPTKKTQEKKDDHAKAEKPKKKEKRPADAPKWYKTGYSLYMEENRETIQKADPSVSNSEVSKLGSVKFKALPDKEKQKWMDEAAADKVRFDQEMEVYNSKQEEREQEI
jgi:hypothetical protein